MLRTVSPFILLVFLAASFPATLAAQEKTLSLERNPSHSRPPGFVEPSTGPPGFVGPSTNPPGFVDPSVRPPNFDGRPAKPPFNAWPPRPGRPGFRPPYNRPRPPQWSISINRPPKPLPPWYGTCPPYCLYDTYSETRQEEKTEYFTEANEPPEEPTYFQSKGAFEALEEAAPASPPAPEDGRQADMDSYNLMMRAWQ